MDKKFPPISHVTDTVTDSVFWRVKVCDVNAPDTIAKMRRQSVGVKFKGAGPDEEVFFQSDYMLLNIIREHLGMPLRTPTALPEAADEQNGTTGKPARKRKA